MTKQLAGQKIARQRGTVDHDERLTSARAATGNSRARTLPTPLSPRSNTEASDPAACLSISKIACIFGEADRSSVSGTASLS